MPQARLRQALAGHDSWPPKAAGKLVRFTDQPDPFSGILATEVWHPCSLGTFRRSNPLSLALQDSRRRSALLVAICAFLWEVIGNAKQIYVGHLFSLHSVARHVAVR